MWRSSVAGQSMQLTLCDNRLLRNYQGPQTPLVSWLEVQPLQRHQKPLANMETHLTESKPRAITALDKF